LKKSFFFIIVCFIIGCSSSKESVEGTVCVIGNEPFTSLALQVDSSTVYKLTGEEEALKELTVNQGRKVKICFSEIDSTELPKIIKIYKHEILK